MCMNVAIGMALTALLVSVALIAPSALRSVVDGLLSPFLLIGMATALFVVNGIRRVVLGPARKQELRPVRLVVTYTLAALPLGVAALSLGALVTFALVFHGHPRVDFVQSFLLLLIGFVMFSMTVKTGLNAQMLMRRWRGR
jgi:hypothetical protein